MARIVTLLRDGPNVWRMVALASLVVASLVTAYGLGRVQAANPQEVEACVNRLNGQVRMSPNGQPLHCTSYEVLRTWAGEGQPGPEGAPGADGVSGYQVISQSFALPSEGNALEQTLFCPSGKKVLGGGARILRPDWRLAASTQINETAWTVLALGSGSTPAGTDIMTIDVICANVAE